MTNDFKNILTQNGYTQFSFSEWYYTRTLPWNIIYGEKLYMVYKEKLTAFKILACAYVGKNISDGGYDNSYGPYNEWVCHLMIAGVGNAIMTLSNLAGKELFRSVEDYNKYVDSKDDVYRVHIGEDTKHSIPFGELFFNRFTYKNRDCNTWNKSLVGYTAKKGELKASKTEVVINYLYTDANGVYLYISGKSRYGSDCFPTELMALEHAKVSEVVDFDETDGEENVTEIEIDIHIKATTKDGALEQIKEVLDKEFD